MPLVLTIESVAAAGNVPSRNEDLEALLVGLENLNNLNPALELDAGGPAPANLVSDVRAWGLCGTVTHSPSVNFMFV